MKTETKQYRAIDAAKFIMSLLIVAIHAEPLSSVNSAASYMLTEIICKIAVPYFFTAVGFLHDRLIAGGSVGRYAFALAMLLISAVLIRRLSEKKDFGLMKLLYE